ncbi:MAG: ribose 5-phosphate isomerase B [Bacilli bacterium]|jgi:ribose 5-phosphate isomerase B|nr:ribose 5-phosphate isomerase B [Bacilli bacterium]MDY0064357.1 ribose 5-phosphate isomerase B [Bacilli bacterium]
MRISIGSDHGGFLLKQQLVDALHTEWEIFDEGTYSQESVDYPVYAQQVCDDVVSKKSDLGILICTTGIGMCISANKVKEIRAALVTNVDGATLARQHNDSNVLCLGAKYTPFEEAIKIARAFVNAEFEGGRHERRVGLIQKQEEKK